ncbi:MAG: Fic family protein [Kiritimatiellales bacterium]
MKTPQAPMQFDLLFKQVIEKKRLPKIFQLADELPAERDYPHWDQLRRKPAPKGFSHEEWWVALKMKRKAAYRIIPLCDKAGKEFVYFIPDSVQELLHEIDFGGGGFIGMPDPVTNPQTRDRYIVSSLIQEAITSSQLEGAVTTREVAKEMIKTGRAPRDRSEQMILNNYTTMQKIIRIKDQKMSPELLFDIHRSVTKETLDNPDAAGRLRTPSEQVRVMDEEGEVYHTPPLAEELSDRLQQMCRFANGETPEQFIPPVVRAILLHFWLAYDHPFVDGNGRTARALFYWCMLRNNFWLFEFVSISNILVKAPVQYARSFLHTETDENDLNYFILYQMDVINRAICALHEYIDLKQQELLSTTKKMRFLKNFNHRQQALLTHALRHPAQEYTIASHRRSHGTAYATARADLLDLVEKKLLIERKSGNAMIFSVAPDLSTRLRAEK